MEITRIFDILEHIRIQYPEKKDALASKENGNWVLYSTKDYYQFAHRFSCGLLAMGIKKGDRIITISNNRPEWNFADMGMNQIGAVHVPVYPTISKEDYQYIFNHCEPRLVIVSDKSLYDMILPIAKDSISKPEVYTFNPINQAKNWVEILEAGDKKETELKPQLEKIKKDIRPEDLLTIIYTSGTTGFPKGVMLSHHNVLTNCKGARIIHPFNQNHRTLSFLPICHIFERTINYHWQMEGVSIYYAESLGTIGENMKEVKPDVFISVPRLIERVYDRILNTGKNLPGIKKSIFFWAVNLGLKFDYVKKGSWLYRMQIKLARKLVFSKWKAALGGKVELIIVGSAALQPRLSRVFGAAGIPLLEGYGLTENSPVVSVNNYNSNEIMVGSVGPPFQNVTVRIAEDGEILVKGPSVMMGYYKEPQQTAETIDAEGWLHTGDIGIMVDGKYLKITDRKKEIFKLSSGKYIAPQSIENILKESMFIEQAFVIGENQKFASAILVPNFQFLHNWASIHKIHFQDNAQLIAKPLVVDRFRKEISQINRKIGQTERIKRFRIVADEWSIATGELSPTLKLRRKPLYEKYKILIEEIFSVDKGGDLED